MEERVNVIPDLVSHFLIMIIKVAFEAHGVVTRFKAHFQSWQEIGMESEVLVFQLVVKFDKCFKFKLDLVTFRDILFFFWQFIRSLDLKFMDCGRNVVYHFDVATQELTYGFEFHEDENWARLFHKKAFISIWNFLGQSGRIDSVSTETQTWLR